MVPGPLPESPDEIVAKDEGGMVGAHEHVACVVTVRSPEPPEAGTLTDGGTSVYEHAVCLTVTFTSRGKLIAP